ncbi:hypothetical protein AAB992_16660 [Burkholderia contaminans]|uniref:hypothetical protein n=1 Tax=Burkholderia contaminans TaxID=488447 RepID=UPI002417B9F8|nr:hypothetical protein [Burkholderia contaminans]WFN10167.1 hypothetical protein LXE92_01640 [Burkholderia contaminans]
MGGVILINSVAASIPSAGTRHPTPAGCLLRPAPPAPSIRIDPFIFITPIFTVYLGTKHVLASIRKEADYIQ